MSIIRDTRFTFRSGNMVNRLIIVNVAVFLLMLLMQLVFSAGKSTYFEDHIIDWFAMPYDWHQLIYRPHTILTNIFTHISPWHVLFNMLGLYWFGSIFGDLAGDRRVLPLYIYSGIVGSLVSLGLYYAVPHWFPGAGVLLGASGAVLAMLFAAATLAPDYKIFLFFIGPVSIKYIAFFYAVIDLFGMAGALNAGGHAAHIGGALFGWLFVYQLRRGRDWSRGMNKFFNYFKQRPAEKPSKVRVAYRRTGATVTNEFNSLSPSERQRRIDEILDKISKSGYDSLNKEEKEILFKASKD